jgi:xanthine/CO dehydrogenase XdhC/CoxF family maturation factor
MKELDSILQLWKRTEQAGESAVLATVVKTLGSSYRLPGAHLLVTSTGQRAGSVSGGCLEDDLVKKAWWFTQNGPVIRRYDTTADGEIASGGYGLGCNGTIDVLLERILPQTRSIITLAAEAHARRVPAGVAHFIEPKSAAGRRLIVDTDGFVSHNIEESQLATRLESEAKAAVAEGASRHVTVEGIKIFMETLLPPVRLVVFGAGDDAIPLTKIAKFLGWQVMVFDGRAHYATRERFPLADLVAVRQSGQAAAAVDRWTVAVIMNHSYTQDLEVLKELTHVPLLYLGLLGPRKRTDQLLSDSGLDERLLASDLHSPMGLDIGADGPEQVALAVIAEIQASLNRRTGGPLRDRRGSIHAREGEASENIATPVQSIACA